MDDIKDKDKDKKDENLSRQQDETGTDGDDLAVDEHSDYKPVDRFDLRPSTICRACIRTGSSIMRAMLFSSVLFHISRMV